MRSLSLTLELLYIEELSAFVSFFVCCYSLLILSLLFILFGLYQVKRVEDFYTYVLVVDINKNNLKILNVSDALIIEGKMNVYADSLKNYIKSLKIFKQK